MFLLKAEKTVINYAFQASKLFPLTSSSSSIKVSRTTWASLCCLSSIKTLAVLCLTEGLGKLRGESGEVILGNQ